MKYEINLMLTDSSYKVLMDICTIQEVNLMKLCVIFFKMTLNQDSSTPVQRDGVLQMSDPSIKHPGTSLSRCSEILANYIQVCLI